ncbi:DUF1883 domain-containing protein [Ruminococcus sp.]|uniref:DUF1883 domain-containing protein n=1 Tax=Ruminococcus sp. TaxID=41978 RepID=UPI002E8153B7|nr:DUF1883 domain-containing protein [Ruminococcus sp.]MEE3491540.1 DUF1883 domain-containing protein [Ruminococcus sp.]
MSSDNISVEASIIDNGKTVKGTLTLFIDEYVFGLKRQTVNWENTVCEKGTVTVKSFLRSTMKTCITFKSDGSASPAFILEQDQIDIVLNAVNSFAQTIKKEREEKLARERAESEAKKKQIEEEKRIKEEAKRKADEEYQIKQEELQRRKAEENRIAREAQERRLAEKQKNIQRAVETVKNQPEQQSKLTLSLIAKKAGSCFLDNPYRVLGISCLATTEDANSALDKLKKLARLKALESYRSPFDLVGIEKPVRDLSVAQNALTLLKDTSNKWFWFSESDACIAWQSGKYRIELSKDGEEFGTYDLFLANYLYAVLCDPDFRTPETWKRVLSFYCFICSQSDLKLLYSRFNPGEQQNLNQSDLFNSYRNSIFKPILLLCERDDLDAILRLYKCIRECNNMLLSGLTRNVLGKLVSWFTDKESDLLTYLARFRSSNHLTDIQGKEIRERGDNYCKVVEPVFKMVLRDFRGDPVRYDMIKESYRTTTYELMYQLNKCDDKSNAVHFANKCYTYCKSDDKKRIKNTFGEVNIKAIDWSVPHTSWDIKGDEYYFGQGYPVDYTQALYWYHKAADAGNMHSQNSIGVCYQKGHGVPQDDCQAASWFEKACESGNPEGAFNLANCYYTGTGVEKSIDEALKYWSKAAKLGHPAAQQKYDEVFASLQTQRRSHRARNHVCHDLGFQMTTGPQLVAEVTLNRPAYVYLVNQQGYQNYLNGNNFTHQGGYSSTSPYRIRIPSSNHWYLIVDNGDEPFVGIVSSVKVKRA